MANVLVTGGAGYVGGATTAWLIDLGHRVFTIDNLSRGHRQLVLSNGFYKTDIGNRENLKKILKSNSFDCVMHFAAFALVGESTQYPEKYEENNVNQTRVFLETLLEFGVKRFIFSSTCAVFGNPGNKPMDESLEKKPINPYGETKLKVEKILEEFSKTQGLHAIALRYFNAAGAEHKLRTGEWHNEESHLIPNILKSVLDGTPLSVFGTDYPTPDGTCIRDYVHVSDLAMAHTFAMERLCARDAREGNPGIFEAFNLGSSSGYSVKEIITACEKVIGKKIAYSEKSKRPGDPPRLVAASTHAKKEIGFKTQFSLNDIIKSAWAWEKKLRGFGKAIFLDRDGTINVDPGYLDDPEKIKLFPKVGAALFNLQSHGFSLIVVSNQSGIGRGKIKLKTLENIHTRMSEILKEFGVKITAFYFCPHHPDDACLCRKPRPALLLNAAQDLGININESYMVGDNLKDLKAGKAAACKGTCLVRTGVGRESEKNLTEGLSDFTGDSLFEVSQWILAQQK